MATSGAVCVGCGGPVVPGAPGVSRAVEVIFEQDYGGEPAEPAEGREVWFHDDHRPAGSSHYRFV
jgi:hypothetical protein